MSGRAFEVFDGEELVAYLGEGPGPMVLHAGTDQGFVTHPHCRMTSFNLTGDTKVAFAVEEEPNLSAVASRLRREGFSVEAVEYAEVFAPGAMPTVNPVARAGR